MRGHFPLVWFTRGLLCAHPYASNCETPLNNVVESGDRRWAETEDNFTLISNCFILGRLLLGFQNRNVAGFRVVFAQRMQSQKPQNKAGKPTLISTCSQILLYSHSSCRKGAEFPMRENMKNITEYQAYFYSHSSQTIHLMALHPCHP